MRNTTLDLGGAFRTRGRGIPKCHDFAAIILITLIVDLIKEGSRMGWTLNFDSFNLGEAFNGNNVTQNFKKIPF